jgi:hypothetical protein
MNGNSLKTITIDSKSIVAANSGQLDLSSIYETLSLPQADSRFISTSIDGYGFVLSPSFQPTDTLLTISLAEDGPLTPLRQDERVEALQRIIICTTKIAIGKPRSIRPAWRPYHSGNLLTFQADRLERRPNGEKASSGRIVLEIRKDVGFHVFAFLLDQSASQPLEAMSAPPAVMEEVTSRISTALAAVVTEHGNDDGTYNLETVHTEVGSRSRTADGWYSQFLNASQRRFVDHDMTESVRLIGPAGTGKTRALAVKTAKLLESDKYKRILFLTHATQTAEDVERMIYEMAPDLGLEATTATPPRLVITTLYALANQVMAYNLRELTPVSLDGHEGKRFQADILNDGIERYRKSEWIAYRAACSAPFRQYMEASKDSAERKFLLWDLLNEFACVIDAEGIRSGREKRKQYLSEKRKPGMMPLETIEERTVVLGLYDAFRADLRNLAALGSDQMITDFLNYLDGYHWDTRRATDGFDVILVDELHLFNRQERMVFHHLSMTHDQTPAVAVAYDAKQSPRDTFLRLPSMEAKGLDLWRDAKIPKGARIDLVDVFRYTPQITKALKKIDDAVPGQNLDDDWPPYAGVAKTADGPIPTLTVLPKVTNYGAVLRRAKQLQNDLGGNGRVAVLFVNNDSFQAYLKKPELADSFVAVASRDDAGIDVRSTKRFVMSMPEYVAGLQFHTVLLLDVSQEEVPDGPYSSSRLRGFIAQVYLGASRAERQLELYATDEFGGASKILSKAVLDKTILFRDLAGFNNP